MKYSQHHFIKDTIIEFVITLPKQECGVSKELHCMGITHCNQTYEDHIAKRVAVHVLDQQCTQLTKTGSYPNIVKTTTPANPPVSMIGELRPFYIDYRDILRIVKRGSEQSLREIREIEFNEIFSSSENTSKTSLIRHGRDFRCDHVECFRFLKDHSLIEIKHVEYLALLNLLEYLKRLSSNGVSIKRLRRALLQNQNKLIVKYKPYGVTYPNILSSKHKIESDRDLDIYGEGSFNKLANDITNTHVNDLPHASLAINPSLLPMDPEEFRKMTELRPNPNSPIPEEAEIDFEGDVISDHILPDTALKLNPSLFLGKPHNVFRTVDYDQAKVELEPISDIHVGMSDKKDVDMNENIKETTQPSKINQRSLTADYLSPSPDREYENNWIAPTTESDHPMDPYLKDRIDRKLSSKILSSKHHPPEDHQTKHTVDDVAKLIAGDGDIFTDWASKDNQSIESSKGYVGFPIMVDDKALDTARVLSEGQLPLLVSKK